MYFLADDGLEPRVLKSGPGDRYDVVHLDQDGLVVARLACHPSGFPVTVARRLSAEVAMQRTGTGYVPTQIGDSSMASTIDVTVGGEPHRFESWIENGQVIAAGRVGELALAVWWQDTSVAAPICVEAATHITGVGAPHVPHG